MNKRQEFRMMCGVAVDGLAHGAMQQHLADCDQCRRKIVGLAGVRKSVFDRQTKGLAGLTLRFVDRARAEGIPLRLWTETKRVPLGWKIAFPALALVLLVAPGMTHRNRGPEFRETRILPPRVDVSRGSTVGRHAPRPNFVAARDAKSGIGLPVGHRPSPVKVSDCLFFGKTRQHPAAFLAVYDPGASQYHPRLLLASARTDGAVTEADGFSFQVRAAEYPSQTAPHIDWQQMRLPQIMSVAEIGESR